MKHITHDSPQKAKVQTIMVWPKCDFCGFCHPADLSKCPRIQWFDKSFNARRNQVTIQ